MGRDPHGNARYAALSVASNSLLIVLKIVAGLITGSVSILSEAAHSTIDLLASVVALVSIRKAGEPADAEHRYGHEKMENLAAAFEGVLILFGAAIITYASILRLINGAQVQRLGVGIVVIGVSAAANLVVGGVLGRRASETGSAALGGDAAHLSADAATSVAVLVGLALVAITGAQWIDPVVALFVAAAIVVTGGRILRDSTRVLVDEALPPEEVEVIRATVLEQGAGRGVVGFHKLRTRSAGSRRYVDLHIQFAAGTTLEDAHSTAHELQDAISERLGDADILIHIEPEDRVRPEL
jgi:cation diffusion facilitator family transporter